MLVRKHESNNKSTQKIEKASTTLSDFCKKSVIKNAKKMPPKIIIALNILLPTSLTPKVNSIPKSLEFFRISFISFLVKPDSKRSLQSLFIFFISKLYHPKYCNHWFQKYDTAKKYSRTLGICFLAVAIHYALKN